MRILVAGSRTWTDRDRIRAELISIRPPWDGSEPPTVVHGAAVGADIMAATIAAGMGWHVEAHHAHWDHYGRRAGAMRNKAMVARGADICIVFIKDGSRGATMLAELAEKAGIPTKRIEE